jgi:hypothetical protein
MRCESLTFRKEKQTGNVRPPRGWSRPEEGFTKWEPAFPLLDHVRRRGSFHILLPQEPHFVY